MDCKGKKEEDIEIELRKRNEYKLRSKTEFSKDIK